MRLRTMDKGMRVYLAPDDYKTMLDAAENREIRMAMKVMARCGLRSVELDFGPHDVRESTNDDVDILFLTIYGKDTKGRDTEGKRRDVWMPRDLYEELEEFRKIVGNSESLGYFPKSTRTLSRYMKKSAENAVLKTGNEDYGYVTNHDFRAYFATNMLLREGVDIETVMELGGWVDRETMDPYIDASFDDIIQDSLADAGLLGEDVVEPEPSPVELLRDEITALRDAVNKLDPRVSVEGQRDDDQPGLDRF